MSQKSFEYFGRLADELEDPTAIASRYDIQKSAEKRIILDIVRKLDLKAEDSLLEIGCGVGNLMIPLSFMVDTVTGIDHIKCLERMKKIYPACRDMRLIAGNFFETVLKETYDKVLVYSVLHYLSNPEEVIRFIRKAVDNLKPWGLALFGDIPNKSAKERFLSTQKGRDFDKDWKQKMKSRTVDSADKINAELTKLDDEDVVQFNDQVILDIIKDLRRRGYHAYVLPQPHDLPFGYTREDILVQKVVSD